MANLKSEPCFIDVHCHLDLYNEKDIKIKDAVENAKKAGVLIINAQGVNPASNRNALSLAKEYPEIKASLGLYPIDSLNLTEEAIGSELEFIEINKNKIIALGEVGLDFKEDLENHEKQLALFGKIVNLAIKINKPLIIHSRKAEKETIELLEKLKAKKVVMHCFSGKFPLVKKILDNNWMLTVPTSVISSEHFQKIAKEAPLENLFCETDSPYLHPFKQWPNEPALVVESYRKLAQMKNVPLEDVKKKIFENYLRVFFD